MSFGVYVTCGCKSLLTSPHDGIKIDIILFSIYFNKTFNCSSSRKVQLQKSEDKRFT